MELRGRAADVGRVFAVLLSFPQGPQQVVVPVDQGRRPQQLDDPLGHGEMVREASGMLFACQFR